MSEPAAQTRKRPTASHRPSLRRTAVEIAALAAVAAAIVWSVLFVDLLRKHTDAAATPPVASTRQDPGLGAQAPAPVTTRTS